MNHTHPEHFCVFLYIVIFLFFFLFFTFSISHISISLYIFTRILFFRFSFFFSNVFLAILKRRKNIVCVYIYKMIIYIERVKQTKKTKSRKKNGKIIKICEMRIKNFKKETYLQDNRPLDWLERVGVVHEKKIYFPLIFFSSIYIYVMTKS